MKLSRLFVLAFLFSIGMSPAIAQESIRLQFEIVKDGATVARPEMSVNLDSASRIAIDGIGQLEFTPTLRGSDLAIAFDVRSGGKQMRPSLVITRSEPGYLSWKSDAPESFKVSVAWVR